MGRRDLELEWRRFLDLLAPVHDRARAMARRLAPSIADGDDLFQDALLRAFEKLSTLRDESRFASWFYAVLLSVHRSRSRRSFWRRFFSLDGERDRGGDPIGEDGTRRAEEDMRARRIARALATLPAVQREAVVLFELEDFSVEEIAGLQKVSLSAVKSRISRGRDRLRRYYERLGFGDHGARPVRRKRKSVAHFSGRPVASPSLAWNPTTHISGKEKRNDRSPVA